MNDSSRVVDSKIVELSLENENFESNANKSLSTLDKLKKGFTFDNSGKGIDTARVNVNALTAGVRALSGGFNGLQQAASVGIGEIAKIKLVSDAINYVEEKVASLGRTFNELSFAQVDAGWNKYAEKTSSVQTIMSATSKEWSKEAQENGEQMEYVNAQLQKLNWFTDETSYNFLDMVNNIGKFTSNSIALDKSVTAMQGISTWAAKSGANVTEASRAMYNLSQAMGVGSVKLMDWKSIENANMGTAEFKETAIQTAESMKLLTKVGDGVWKTLQGHEVSVTNFRESLKDDWFTNDVLIETLSKYGGFTDKLYSFINSLSGDVTASKVLGYIDEFAKSGTLENIDEVASELGISSEDLTKALSELGSADLEFGRKAFKAAQEAKTFQEAIDATKDAVSTAWMNTFETLFGNYEEAKKLWTDLANDLWDIFAGPVNNFNDKLTEAFESTGTTTLNEWERFENAGLASDAFKTAIIAVGKKHGEITDEMSADIKKFDALVKDGVISVNSISEAWTLLTGQTADGVAQSTDNLENLKEAALAVIRGDYGNDMNQRFAKLAENGYDPQQVQDYVNALRKASNGTWNLTDDIFEQVNAQFASSVRLVEGLTDAQLEEIGVTRDQVEAFKKQAEEAGKLGKVMISEDGSLVWERKSGKELWTDALYTGMTALLNLTGTVKSIWSDVFPETTAGAIYIFLERFNAGATSLANFTENSEVLKAALRSLFSGFDLIVRVVRSVKAALISAVKESGFLDFIGNLIIKISDGIVKFREWTIETDAINKAIGFISDTVKGGIDLIRTWFDSFIKIPVVNRNINRFSHAFKFAFRSFGPYMSEGITRFKDFIGHIKEMGGLKKENIGAVLKDFKENVLDYFLNFPGFKAVGKAFQGLRKDVKRYLNGIGTAIWEYFEHLRTNLDGTFAGKLLGFVMDAISSVREKLVELSQGSGDGGRFSITGVFKTILSGIGDFVKFLLSLVKKLVPLAIIALPIMGIIKLIKGAMDLFFSFPRLMNRVKDTIGSISSYFDAKKQAEQADALWTVAKSIGLLVAAVYILTKIDTKKLIVATVVLGALAGLMLGVMWAINKMNDNGSDKVSGIKGMFDRISESVAGFLDAQKANTLTKALRNIAVSIGILVASVYVLAKLDTKQMLISVGVISGLVLGLTGVMYLLTRMDASKTSINVPAMLAIAIGVNLLVRAINKIEASPDTWKKLAIVELLLASLTVVAVILSKFKSKGTLRGAVMMAAVAGSVVLLVTAMNKLKVDKNIWKRLLVVELMIATLTGVSVILSKFKAKASLKNAITLIALAGSIYILSMAIKNLADISPERLRSASKALAEIMVVAGLFEAVTGALKPNALSTLAIALLIAAVGHVLASVASVPAENLLPAVDAIEKVLVSVGLAMAAMAALGMFGPALMTGVTATLLFVGGLALIVGLLGKFAGKGVAGFATTITGALPQIGQDLSDFAEKAKPFFTVMTSANTKSIESLKALASSIVDIAKGEFVSSIYKLFTGKSPFKSFGEHMPELASALSAYANALDDSIDYDKVYTSAAAVELLATLANNVIPEGGVIGWLKGNGSKIKNFAKQLPELAGGLSEYSKSINSTDFNEEKIQASASLVTLLSDLTNDVIPEGGVIGWLKGNGSKISQFAKQLPTLADGLSAYTAKINETDFNENKTSASAELVKLLSELSNEHIPDGGVIGWLTGNGSKITDFARQLPRLAIGLSSYVDKIDSSTFDTDKLIASTNLAGILAGLASESIPAGGVLGWVEGNSTKISDFAKQLPSLALGLVGYANNLSLATFDEDKVSASTSLASMLASLASNDIPAGGVLGWLDGNSTKIKDFAKQLPTLALGLVGYANNLTLAVFDEDKVSSSTNLASILGALASNDIPAGGVLGWLSGNSTIITDFAKQLPSLAEGLGGYVSTISQYTFVKKDVVASTNLASILAALSSKDIPTGGLVGWLRGNDNKISKFAFQLPSLAAGLGKYVEIVSKYTFTADQVTASSNLASVLGALAGNDIPEGGIVGWLKGNDNKISKFAGQLPELAAGLGGYVEEVGRHTFDKKAILRSTSLAETLSALTKDEIPKGGILGWLEGNSTKITNFATQLPELAAGLGGFVDKIAEYSFESDAISAATSLAETLGVLTKDSIPNNGILNWLQGTTSDKICSFSTQLPILADGLGKYVDEVTLHASAFNSDAIDASAGLASVLGALAGNELPEGGIIGWLEGNDTKISDFAGQLPSLATGLSGFVENISSDFSTGSKVFATTKAFDLLSTIVENLPTFTTVISSADTVSFGENVGYLGSALGTLTSDKTGINAWKLKTISESISTLLPEIDKLSEIELAGDFMINSSVDTWVANLGKVVSGLIDTEEIKTSGAENLKEAVSAINATDLSSLGNAGEGASDEVSEGLAKGASSITSAMSDLLQAAGRAISDNYDSFQVKGRIVMNKFGLGLSDKQDYVTSKVASIVTAAAAIVDSHRKDFSEAGRFAVLGFAGGIALHTYVAVKSASEMARASLEAVKRVLNSHSPSKETEKLGSYFGQGFVLAIDGYQSTAYQSGAGVAEAARSGLQKGVAAIKNVLGSDVGGDPVIRPVLDLSEIQNGAGMIGDILRFDEPIGVMGSLNAISTNSRYNPNSDILSALSSLQKTLGSQAGGNTYVIDGVTYDDGTNISSAVRTLVHAATVNRRMN